MIFKELYKNEEIRAREVRLINKDGEMLGIFSIVDAQKMADDQNLDLVLISPAANPVVCKIMDYAKHKYERTKQVREDRKKQTYVELKELWLSPVIDIGDLNTQVNKARKFFEKGNKVRLSIRMKGRQIAHPELSFQVMNDFFEMVSDIALIEKPASRMGRTVAMILAPQKKITNVKED